MPRSRLHLAGWLLVALLALTLPAVSLAGGGSAGDQQYTDPFSGGGTHHSTSTAAPTTAPPAPATSPAPAALAPTATSGGPTATIAGSSDPTVSGSSLPYTGYDAWTAVGFGLTMVVGGVVLRRRAQRS